MTNDIQQALYMTGWTTIILSTMGAGLVALIQCRGWWVKALGVLALVVCIFSVFYVAIHEPNRIPPPRPTAELAP